MYSGSEAEKRLMSQNYVFIKAGLPIPQGTQAEKDLMSERYSQIKADAAKGGKS